MTVQTERFVRQATRVGGPDVILTDDQVREFITAQLDDTDLDGASVCVLVPDDTRTCPLPLLMKAVHAALAGRVSKLTCLVALGTHKEMSEEALAVHLGFEPGRLEETYPGMVLMNHEWWKPGTLADLGTIPASRLEELSDGRLSLDVKVLLNKAVVEHDVALVVGPTLPHEVVGISGGNKYFFPGVGGHDVIDVSHWLGALITSAKIIGTTGITPVRALINEGSELIPAKKLAFCVVTAEGTDLHSVSYGDTISSWADAAPIAAATHVEYRDEPVKRVLALIPPLYKDLWTAAKGFYKLEPVVADGGEIIIYAPHVSEIAQMHPEIYDIGYHCRDYFVEQWDTFKDVPWGVLAHSTHGAGAGTYDKETGVEKLRIRMTLATAVPEDVCHKANLGYLNPDDVDIAAYQADPDTFVVPHAGEVLYRLRED